MNKKDKNKKIKKSLHYSHTKSAKRCDIKKLTRLIAILFIILLAIIAIVARQTSDKIKLSPEEVVSSIGIAFLLYWFFAGTIVIVMIAIAYYLIIRQN